MQWRGWRWPRLRLRVRLLASCIATHTHTRFDASLAHPLLALCCRQHHCPPHPHPDTLRAIRTPHAICHAERYSFCHPNIAGRARESRNRRSSVNVVLTCTRCTYGEKGCENEPKRKCAATHRKKGGKGERGLRLPFSCATKANFILSRWPRNIRRSISMQTI